MSSRISAINVNPFLLLNSSPYPYNAIIVFFVPLGSLLPWLSSQNQWLVGFLQQKHRASSSYRVVIDRHPSPEKTLLPKWQLSVYTEADLGVACYVSILARDRSQVLHRAFLFSNVNWNLTIGWFHQRIVALPTPNSNLVSGLDAYLMGEIWMSVNFKPAYQNLGN